MTMKAAKPRASSATCSPSTGPRALLARRRCARGLGWCHIEDLKAYRLDEASYDAWVKSGRTISSDALAEVPVVAPTRSWCFRTLDVDISFGEYKPEPNEAAWGLDMFAVGPHDTERRCSRQATASGPGPRGRQTRAP